MAQLIDKIDFKILLEDFQEDLCRDATPETAAATSPIPVAGHCRPTPLQETLKHSQNLPFCIPVGIPGSTPSPQPPMKQNWLEACKLVLLNPD